MALLALESPNLRSLFVTVSPRLEMCVTLLFILLIAEILRALIAVERSASRLRSPPVTLRVPRALDTRSYSCMNQ